MTRRFADDDVKQDGQVPSFIVQELCESRGGRPGLSVLTSLLVSVDLKLYVQYSFCTGLSLSLICQPTSEDIKQHNRTVPSFSVALVLRNSKDYKGRVAGQDGQLIQSLISLMVSVAVKHYVYLRPPPLSHSS